MSSVWAAPLEEELEDVEEAEELVEPLALLDD